MVGTGEVVRGAWLLLRSSTAAAGSSTMMNANDDLVEAPVSRNRPTLPPPGRCPETVRPPPRVSVTRYKSGAPVDELLYRMSMGDTGAALDAAQALFDAGSIPVVVLPLRSMTAMLGYRADLLLSCVDGESSLAKVIEASGLEMMDALRALGELLAEDVIAVC
jgi:hypothetical protein